MAKKVVGYARTSTLLQKESIEVQKKRIQQYCNSRKWKLLRIYSDVGKSGKSVEQRTAFKKMMLGANNKDFEAIVFTKLDRFGRSLRDLLNTAIDLKEHEVDFISIDDSIDTSTAQGRLMFQIMGAFAEFERSAIRERLEAGLVRAKAKGMPIGRKKKIIPKEELLKYYQENKLSYRSMAKIYGVSPTTIYNRLLELGALK